MEIYNADANSRISEFLQAELRGFVIPAIYSAAYADIAYVYCHGQIDPVIV